MNWNSTKDFLPRENLYVYISLNRLDVLPRIKTILARRKDRKWILHNGKMFGLEQAPKWSPIERINPAKSSLSFLNYMRFANED